MINGHENFEKRCVTLISDLATLLPWRFHSWCRIQAFGDPEQNEFPPALTSSWSINASPPPKERQSPKKDNLATSYNHRGIYPWNRENLWNISVNKRNDIFCEINELNISVIGSSQVCRAKWVGIGWTERSSPKSWREIEETFTTTKKRR